MKVVKKYTRENSKELRLLLENRKHNLNIYGHFRNEKST